jgi:hypothetical protein
VEVFPYIGYEGSTGKHRYWADEKEYADGSYRRYVQSTFNHREVTLNFEDVGRDVKVAITDFFNARMSSVTDYEFILFVFEETATVDISAMDETGQHKARFPSDAELDWTLTGPCDWSAQLTIKLLD